MQSGASLASRPCKHSYSILSRIKTSQTFSACIDPTLARIKTLQTFSPHLLLSRIKTLRTFSLHPTLSRIKTLQTFSVHPIASIPSKQPCKHSYCILSRLNTLQVFHPLLSRINTLRTFSLHRLASRPCKHSHCILLHQYLANILTASLA